MSLFIAQVRDVRRSEKRRKKERKLGIIKAKRKRWSRKYKKELDAGVYQVTEYRPIKKKKSKSRRRQ